MAKDGKKRILELRDLLDQANRAYYVDAQPIMSDRDYDARMKELIALEAEYPELRDTNSPSQRIGDQPVEGFRTVKHAVPMTSIDNTYGIDELGAWHARVMKGLELGAVDDAGLFDAKRKGDGEPPVRFVCDPKIDGIAINLRYESGQLASAVTRGDGEKGDD